MIEFNDANRGNKKYTNNENIKEILTDVIKTIKLKNYDPVSQLRGYIETENPVYIPRDNGAREKILSLHKEEIVNYLLNYFIEDNKIC